MQLNKQINRFKKFKKNFFISDALVVVMLFVIAIVTTYKLSFYYSFSFQIILLLIYSVQKKPSVIWLAFLFIVENQPGGVFSMLDPENTLAIVHEGHLGQLYFWILFVLISAIKYFKSIKKNRFFFKDLLVILFIYFFFLLLIFGMNTITGFIRMTLPWIILFISPLIFNDLKDYARFFNIIFVFVFINLLIQLVELITFTNLATLLGGNIRQILYIEEGEKITRPIFGILIPFFALIGALYFSIIKSKFFNRNYLNIIIILSFFSLILTATRGYIFAAIFILISYFILVSRTKTKTVIKFSLAVFVMILMLNFIPFLEHHVSQAFSRFETIKYLLQGDVTAGGTLQRVDVRSPAIMNKFYESPFVGFGYGSSAFKYSDGHVGNQNLLLHTGIIGFLLFFLFWIYFIAKLWLRERVLTVNNPFKGSLVLTIVVLLGIIIIHSSSRQVFNYFIDIQFGMLLFIFLTFSNYIYYKSNREELHFKRVKRKILIEKNKPRFIFN